MSGILYDIDQSELRRLDKAEAGYKRKRLQVLTEQNDPVIAEV